MNDADRPRILLVDDEPGILFALEDQLEADFDILTTQSAEEALKLAQAHADIAVIVSDQRMPRMQGDELLAKLRVCSGATRILCSGYADVQAVLRGVNDGAISAFITKPWDPVTLRAKVDEGVEQFRLGRELQQMQRLFAGLLETSQRALFFKDLASRHLRASARYVSWLGLEDEQQLRGKRVSELRPDWPAALELESSELGLLSAPEAEQLIVQLAGPPPEGAPCELCLSVLRSGTGAAEGILGVFQPRADVKRRN